MNLRVIPVVKNTTVLLLTLKTGWKFELFVSDMWKTCSNVSGTWLKNATQVVDKVDNMGI